MTVIPSDPATATRLMLALGGIIIQFGVFEVALQGAVGTIHHGVDERQHGDGDDEKQLPKDMLARNRDYLKKSVQFNGMGPFASDIRRIVSTAKRLAIKRNHIMHGYICEFVEETETVTFRKFNADQTDGIYVGSDLKLTLTDLEALRGEMAAMAQDMGNLGLRLVQTFFGDTRQLLDFSGDA
jgi:hypothetical protein